MRARGRSPYPDAAGACPVLVKACAAASPGAFWRAGTVVGEVDVGLRSEAEHATLQVNTSALPDARVRRVLATTQWQPGDTRFPLTPTRCRIRLRLDREDEGERLAVISSHVSVRAMTPSSPASSG